MVSPAAADDATPLTGDDGIVAEAAERWKACKDWQGVEDERSRDDIKFANADSRNAWQWPQGIYQTRTSPETDLPCLTINTTRVHNDNIINGMSKNGFGIKVRPTGGKASYQSAQVMQSIIRRIEYISKASAAYRKVREQQVDGGIGYILIETAYTSERSFNQDIYLKASRDPTAVYLSPWITEPDGSDATFGFIFERLPRKEFNRKYPKWKNKVGTAPLDSIFMDWISDKEIMVAKYYRKKEKNDTLYSFTVDGNEIEMLASEIKEDSGSEIYRALKEQIDSGELEGKSRKVVNNEVEWFLIAGDKVIDKGQWAGKYIPICRCVGRELVIDATLDRKGHTRPLIDPQRMLNFNASTAVEIVAYQPKSPIMAPARSIEGQEQYKTLNINGFAVTLYNDIDDEQSDPQLAKIDAPKRMETPKPSEAHELGMQTAERHMMLVSGQTQQDPRQEAGQYPESGKAIGQRKEQGETATYHFAEHFSDMLRYIGVQLLDLIPKIYDTKRTLHILDDAGEKSWIMIDPNQEDVVQELEHEKEDEEAVKLAFNPSIGEYECISDPGPDFATQRQEAFDAMSMILQNNKELAAVCADLLFKYGDFPGAEQIMERLQKEIKATKPYLFDDKIEPQMVALQQQNQRLTALNAELMTKLADSNLKIRGRDEKRDIESFNADTKRMEAQIRYITEVMLTPAQKAQMEHNLETLAHQHVYDTISKANAADIEGDGANGDARGNNGFDPTSIGARLAPDGNHYLSDPSRPGKYLMVKH